MTNYKLSAFFVFIQLVAAICFADGTLAQVKNIELKGPPLPKVLQTQMDRDEKLVQKMHNGDVASYMLVRDNPNDYSPFVLFYLGFGLFNSGYHEEGATWYYVAQLRARYDANRTLDKTTGAGVKVLSNRYGEKINKWAFEDPERVQLVGKTAINFVAGNDEALPSWLARATRDRSDT